MQAYFQTFVRYNAWANGRLYDACARLVEDAYLAPRPAFFGSIHGALNHILVGDRIWLARLENEPSSINSLDQILYADLASLRAAREAEDLRIAAFVESLSAERLRQDLHYRNMAGVEQSTPMVQVLAHVFNHQTHHRGQVHDMLSQTDIAPPSLDLIYYLQALPK